MACKACKFFLGVGGKTANVAARGDMGWLSTASKQHLQVFRLYIRLLNHPDDRLCKKVHLWSKSLTGKTWEKNVNNLSHKYNVHHILLNATKSDLNTIESNIYHCDQIDWYNELWNDTNKENGNKQRTYRLHKDTLEPEHHATQSIPRYKRCVLSKLCCGTLPLNIETGRYNNVKLCDRKCTLCQENSIEDEIHFLVDCRFYNDLRCNLFQEANCDIDFNTASSMIKYIKRMTTPNLQKTLCLPSKQIYVFKTS